ncbi:MAG TPA: hypothetical protein VM299_06310 [Solirubrobacteraceae bacterium]|jgi:hypothetical protein|nr:hypothetical protein [Solirubrobacteraceae bacterium]
MSSLDTRKAGSGQTVSFANVRVESESLLPEQLIERIKSAQDAPDVELRIEDHGTASASHEQRA